MPADGESSTGSSALALLCNDRADWDCAGTGSGRPSPVLFDRLVLRFTDEDEDFAEALGAAKASPL